MIKLYDVVLADQGDVEKIRDEMKHIKQKARMEIDNLMKMRRMEKEITEATLSASASDERLDNNMSSQEFQSIQKDIASAQPGSKIRV